MLNVPELDYTNYDQLVQYIRSQIPIYAPEWTDLNDHDPGITTLQTFAWLIDTLNFYINATGEAHRLKYLRLLGIVPERCASSGFVVISSESDDDILPKGTKLYAENTVFETTEKFYGQSNYITALYREVKEGSELKYTDLTSFLGEGQSTFLITSKDKAPVIYFGFNKAFEQQFRFYVDILAHPKRNPFEKFLLSQLEWEYYDGNAWLNARVIEDETCGFLRNGFISLELGKTGGLTRHSHLPAAHYLRAKILHNKYDVFPQISGVYAGCVKVQQTCTYSLAFEMISDGTLDFSEYHANRSDDMVTLAIEDGDGYRFVDRMPEKGQKTLAIISSEVFYEKPEVTLGCARERKRIDIANILELRLALVDEKENRFTLWDECENLSERAYNERVFEFNRETGEIIFGDGIGGMQPEAGLILVPVTVKTSLLSKGNVLTNKINLPSAYESTSMAYNPKETTGGKNAKTSIDLEKEIENKILKTNRAVGEMDYIQIVKETPGLIIDGVSVISSREYANAYGGTPEEGKVYLAVKPYSEHNPKPILGKEYISQIKKNMEHYRLLTVQVEVLPAKYAGVEVEGKILLSPYSQEICQTVEEKLKELIDFMQRKKFGAKLDKGYIFSQLERLPFVTKINFLNLISGDEGAERTEQGDVLVKPDVLTYIRDINVEFADGGSRL
ncbi:MAG: hypothetical protein FWC91_13250 [Defluviitaleaceae bacterium]|nr:hypothetical protein [Defluviitaleaceae bacterium]